MPVAHAFGAERENSILVPRKSGFARPYFVGDDGAPKSP